MNLPASVWIPEQRAPAPAASLPPAPPRSPIKVLHVITKFTTGAGGNTLLSAVGMNRDPYEVWVAARPGGECFLPAEEAGVRTVAIDSLAETIRPLQDLRAYRRLVGLMRRERFSIVHTHTAKAGFLARLAARRARVPVVVHSFHAFPFHDYMGRARVRLYLLLDRFVRRFTDAFVAVSPGVARTAVEQRLAPPGHVTVIPSAVALDELVALQGARASAFRAELGIGADVPLIGTVGRLSFQKSPLDFVHMASIVAHTHPRARFVMVGDGPMEPDARAEAVRLGVDVTFTGFRADAHRIAASFDVFVMPSLYEGLGRALTEALAGGRPVVASAVNGVPDLVRHGVTGLLSPPADPAAVAACVAWLLEHPAEASAMGARGRAAVSHLFAPAQMCASLDALYRALLGLAVGEQLAAEQRPAADGNGARRGNGRVPSAVGSGASPSARPQA